MKNDSFYYTFEDGTKKYIGPFKIWYKDKTIQRDGYLEVAKTKEISSYQCHCCGYHIYPYQISSHPNKIIETPNYGRKGIWICPHCKWLNYKITKKDIERYEQNKGN